MRIAVTTPTGQVGSKVAHQLLDVGIDVVLLAHKADRVATLAERGAQVYEGSLDDPEYVSKATRNIDALFWVTPPQMQADDLRAFQKAVGSAAATAVRDNGIPRVINLSSLGAGIGHGVGPVNGLHDVEQLLNDAATNVMHLRAAFFYENFLWQIEAIRNSAKLFMPLPPATRLPMIATQDIAEVAAQMLQDDSLAGRQVARLTGPEELSFEEAAADISSGIGVQVQYMQVAEPAVRQFMAASGASDNFIDNMLEMYRAAASGELASADIDVPLITMPTRLTQFARDVIAPLLQAPLEA